MTWEAVWDVLKWVLLVLAAGFIGQFGRFFAQRLIERRRQAKASAEAQSESGSEDPQVELARISTEAKIEKKRAKAEVKRLKKLGDDRSEN